ncbi:MAG: FAD/NAD(P)-binding protein [Defluviitaleaceae bacterium]|nr:FAD/NAD(P)-binding protein [Defluviitaleaceae bacterium]MCL2275097.1 FAD/NAD(P)-binding protein [Defluviitaleaceae bacterium]
MCNPNLGLIPFPARIIHITENTADTKTFRVVGEDEKKPFAHMPGQCAMLSLPGVGEAMFSISSASTNEEFYEFSIKRVGKLTSELHTLQVDSPITLRGAYGRPFPVNDVLIGQDLLFIAGGIGLAPLRSVIRYVFDNRDKYGAVDIVYGARSSADLVFLEEIQNEWTARPNTRVHLTIDREEEGWSGNVGFVPTYIKQLSFNPSKIALICGPPVMIKYSLATLIEMGFEKTQVYTTLEMRMKCGIGKCGRCNIGHKYACIDGPVFRCDEIDELPEEY